VIKSFLNLCLILFLDMLAYMVAFVARRRRRVGCRVWRQVDLCRVPKLGHGAASATEEKEMCAHATR